MSAEDLPALLNQLFPNGQARFANGTARGTVEAHHGKPVYADAWEDPASSSEWELRYVQPSEGFIIEFRYWGRGGKLRQSRVWFEVVPGSTNDAVWSALVSHFDAHAKLDDPQKANKRKQWGERRWYRRPKVLVSRSGWGDEPPVKFDDMPFAETLRLDDGARLHPRPHRLLGRPYVAYGFGDFD